jgi:ABC-type Mn2+/Zn2+ transport system permease subunit
VVVLTLRRTLLLAGFDPSHARALGFPLRTLDTLLLALLALAIVASIQAVGIVLVIAMLVTPGATAFLLVRRFDAMLAVAAGGAVAATFIGVYVSFFADASTAACIVLVQALGFVAALCLAPRGGLLRRPRQTASSPA